MAAPAKFMFDRRLDDGNTSGISFAVAEERRRAEEALAKAKRDSHAAGFAEGEAATLAKVEARTATALESIAVATRALLDETGNIAADIRRDCVALALVAARSLAGTLVRRQPLVEIETLLTSCLNELRDELHVDIAVAEPLRDAATDKLEAVARDRGFAGTLTVHGDPDLQPGDCRIDWSKGGVARDMDAIAAAIEERVLRYLEHQELAKAGKTASQDGEDS
jgi:flagellar assembly protein FliH